MVPQRITSARNALPSGSGGSLRGYRRNVHGIVSSPLKIGDPPGLGTHFSSARAKLQMNVGIDMGA